MILFQQSRDIQYIANKTPFDTIPKSHLLRARLHGISGAQNGAEARNFQLVPTGSSSCHPLIRLGDVRCVVLCHSACPGENVVLRKHEGRQAGDKLSTDVCAMLHLWPFALVLTFVGGAVGVSLHK